MKHLQLLEFICHHSDNQSFKLLYITIAYAPTREKKSTKSVTQTLPNPQILQVSRDPDGIQDLILAVIVVCSKTTYLSLCYLPQNSVPLLVDVQHNVVVVFIHLETIPGL